MSTAHFFQACRPPESAQPEEAAQLHRPQEVVFDNLDPIPLVCGIGLQLHPSFPSPYRKSSLRQSKPNSPSTSSVMNGGLLLF